MQQDSMYPSGAAHKATSAPAAPPEAPAEGVGDAVRLRWMRRVLRVMAAASLVSLLLALAFAPQLVTTAALVLAGSCLLLVVIDIGQTRTRVAADAVRSGLASSEAARKAGVRTAVRRALAIGLATFAVVAMALDRTMLVAGSAFALAAIAIFGAPAWLATVGDNEAMASADVEARRGNRP
jgi:hypothetical protein